LTSAPKTSSDRSIEPTFSRRILKTSKVAIARASEPQISSRAPAEPGARFISS
jgi:hypothetical protein